MVPVIIIAVFFSGLAGTIFYAGPRGKLSRLADAMTSQKKGASAMINTTIALIFIGFGVVIPAIFLIANHNNTSVGLGHGIKLTASETNGRTLFGEHCAVCHTLAAASAVGKTGPNLDQIKPGVPLIENTIENGCLADPDGKSEVTEYCLGEGSMPADTVQGTDVLDVAKFVAAVAGKAAGS